MKTITIQKTKKVLATGGALFTALGGLLLGINSIIKVFYPDPPTNTTSPITPTNPQQPVK